MKACEAMKENNLPNILFLTTDQQRFDALGSNSEGRVLTPNLDRLVSEGTNFTRFYVNHPVCMPSRASFLTGRYPSHHGVTTNGIPLPETETTIAHVLSKAGYRTGNLGKLHFIPHSGRDYSQPHPPYGFDVHVNADEPGCYPDAYIKWIRETAPEMESKVRVPDPAKEQRGSFDRWVFEAPDELSYSAWVANETINFIDSSTDKPWFAIAGFYLPHAPCNPTQRWLDLYDESPIGPPLQAERELDDKPDYFKDVADVSQPENEKDWLDFRRYYFASCSMVDHYCGLIVQHLREQGILDNTIVVFYSDHGEAAGDHFMMAKHPTNYESIVKVPAFIRYPRAVPSNTSVESLFESVDLFPTIMEAAELQPPDWVDGVSQWSTIQGSSDYKKECVLIEHHEPKSDFAWKTETAVRTIVTEKYKYWVNNHGHEVLFDLQKDPDEFINFASHPSHFPLLNEARLLLLNKLMNTFDSRHKKIAPY